MREVLLEKEDNEKLNEIKNLFKILFSERRLLNKLMITCVDSLSCGELITLEKKIKLTEHKISNIKKRLEKLIDDD